MTPLKHKLRLKILNFLRDLLQVNEMYQNPVQETMTPVRQVEPGKVMDNQLLAGRNALITGAGQNIGRSIAIEMAKQGANVYFTDLYPERCEELSRYLHSYPIHSKSYISDISRTEDSDTLFNILQQEKILIDILVNNVGVSDEEDGMESLDVAKWQSTFETNLFGPIHLTRLIAQEMVEHNIPGSIIFISSVHQEIPFKTPSYSASKAALGMLIKELALMLAPHNIKVNGIAPGWIIEDENGSPLVHTFAPLGSTINPCYIGRAAVYLASDFFSRYTTGTILKIDAGLSLHDYKTLQ